jgi:two-component system, OmpR family, sensor histidine kinase PrrB
VIGLAFALGAGMVGYLLGMLAARPLSQLRRDSERLGTSPLGAWRVRTDYGTPEVDDVARTLNSNLEQLAAETARRGEALDSARSFAASAAHELRTPLQSALTSLDIARSGRIDEEEVQATIETAHRQLERMAASLAAVRALTDAELADPSWFETLDLVELVDTVVAEETRRHDGAHVTVDAGSDVTIEGWVDGLRLAVANVVRNALVHGRPVGGSPARVRVEVSGEGVVVDDNGPGVSETSRLRILERFERGQSDHPGSGLGLALAAQVARAHGGTITVGPSPDGGARVSLLLGQQP